MPSGYALKVNDLVRRGYDQIAESYAEGRDAFSSLHYLERFAATLPAGGRILDIGCGTGLPAAGFLTGIGFQVHGLDFSPRMVEIARANVPFASFEVRDMLTLRDGEYPVDGIVALYSIFHVDRTEHTALLQRLRTFLPGHGIILLTMGADDWQGTEPDFHGVEMSWSHYDAATNREMVEAAGFRVDLDEIDSSGGERHQVLLARAGADEERKGGL